MTGITWTNKMRIVIPPTELTTCMSCDSNMNAYTFRGTTYTEQLLNHFVKYVEGMDMKLKKLSVDNNKEEKDDYTFLDTLNPSVNSSDFVGLDVIPSIKEQLEMYRSKK